MASLEGSGEYHPPIGIQSSDLQQAAILTAIMAHMWRVCQLAATLCEH